MTKFHITTSGKAAPCTATDRPCPRGEHYDSMRDAAVAAATASAVGVAETPAFKPLSQTQAESWLASLAAKSRTGLSEQYLEEWLTRDHTPQITALETALTQLGDEEAAHRTLKEADLLQPETYWSDHDGQERFSYYSVKHGGTGGGYRQRGIQANSLKQSVLWHKRNDRTTLMTAMNLDPSSMSDGGEVLYSAIAKGLADDLRKQRKEEEDAKEAARLIAPTNWVKIPVKTVRDDLGDHYDEANPQHREFADELEAIGMTRDQYFARPGYRRRDEYKNMVIKKVKARHQELANQAAMSRVPDSIDWQKTSVPKLAEALGPSYDPALSLHQELRAKVDVLTPEYNGKVYLDPDGRPAEREHSHRQAGRWIANDEVTAPTSDQLEAIRQDRVDSSVRFLFSTWKSDRTDALRGFKKRLAEHDTSS